MSTLLSGLQKLKYISGMDVGQLIISCYSVVIMDVCNMNCLLTAEVANVYKVSFLNITLLMDVVLTTSQPRYLA